MHAMSESLSQAFVIRNAMLHFPNNTKGTQQTPSEILTITFCMSHTSFR